MPADPLTRAEIQIFNASERSSQSIRVTGLTDDRSMELPPEGTVISAAGEKPAPKREIVVPPPLTGPVRAGIRAVLARNRPLRLTGDELASLSPGEPVIIESIGHTVHLPAFKEVAEQAADTNRSLIIIARGSENE